MDGLDDVSYLIACFGPGSMDHDLPPDEKNSKGLYPSANQSPYTRPSPPARQGRKGHRKSRHGCYACKRRKIKCPENRPICHNCSRLMLDCRYPSEEAQQVNSLLSMPLVLDRSQLQSTPILFNLTDMRLFHHFLTICYPHIPLGNEEVWVTDIASFAHSYDFLIHAILGLAAAHLDMTSTSNLGEAALSHRVLAIKGLNEALSKPPKTRTDADALLSSCYALSMQSSFLGNSVEDFLVMFRGCRLIIEQQWCRNLRSAFHDLDVDRQVEIASLKFGPFPIINESSIEAAKTSFRRLGPLCENGVEKKVLSHLETVVNALEDSSIKAYSNYMTLCIGLAILPESEFHELIDSSKPIMQVLLGHFAAVLQLIYPIKAREWKNRNLGIPNRNVVFRLDGIYQNLPISMWSYLDWAKTSHAVPW